ncbi:hypothetical protein [uncultured Thiodictyon sp.]|uniref:hypothetical protein n=1 Tax=uncultured Thiodictyon sp. TaxID=1846217 RepID=UPI0025D65E8B|nr:hypothetical protein [uncultured Thiodictyon sp.]
MTQTDCAQCLRPAFTARLARDLTEQRRCINLVGAPGQGRGRLLADLQRTGGTTLWLCADLKEYRYDFPGLIARLWDQTGLPGGQPATLGELADRLRGRSACLLLHHFDAVLDEPDVDAGFDVQFLNGLNALKAHGLTLLGVTERGYTNYVMVTRAGERRVSTLILEREDLRPLTRGEAAAEVARRLPELTEAERARLAEWIAGHPMPLSFLDFVAGRVGDGERLGSWLTRRNQHGRWRREFAARQGHGITPADAQRLRRRLRVWWRAIGGHEIRWPLAGLAKAVERWLGGKNGGD